jgi:hypothetical protein
MGTTADPSPIDAPTGASSYPPVMANGVFHTGYGIVIELARSDLGHPDRPGLLGEITQPVDKRDRELLQCLQYHDKGHCKAEEDDRSPWMSIRRRTVDGRTSLVAAHLPVRHHPTAEESDKHKAMKERIARAAGRHGLDAQIEARSADGGIRHDVLVTGPAGKVGWEAQYSPITATTVRRRSNAAAAAGVTPVWVTNDVTAALIDRAPWARVDDVSWHHIASPLALVIRAGVRHLQDWKCTRYSERPCPANGSACGGYHVEWSLPALCLPQKPATEIDTLVTATAEGAFVPMRIPTQDDPRQVHRMWVPVQDRDKWRDINGDPEPETPREDPPDDELTFTGEELDRTCRYGEENFIFNDPRPRRGADNDTIGLHTFNEVPPRRLAIPCQTRRLDITSPQRAAAATEHGCPIWEIGPCAGCGTPIHRYGPGSAHACPPCRNRATSH